jgi:hypothetical protein
MEVLLKKTKLNLHMLTLVKSEGFNYQTQESQKFTIEANDLIVKVDQPKQY